MACLQTKKRERERKRGDEITPRPSPLLPYSFLCVEEEPQSGLSYTQGYFILSTFSRVESEEILIIIFIPPLFSLFSFF